jgi:hypothetical protein
MKELLEKLQRDTNLAQEFYGTFYAEILQHLFSVATDSAHLSGTLLFSRRTHVLSNSTRPSGINLHSSILAHLFQIVESGLIIVPLNAEMPNNMVYTAYTWQARHLNTVWV